MAPIIIIIVSLILDGILSNFLPYLVNNLSLFTPLLTVVSIFLIYPFYRKNLKKYYLISFLTGIIYSLLYTNLLLYDAIIFFLIAYFSKYLYKMLRINYLNIIFQVIILIIVYELLNVLIITIFNLVPMNLYKIIYKISHSLILNIIYSELLLLIINLLPKKYKRINLN